MFDLTPIVLEGKTKTGSGEILDAGGCEVRCHYGSTSIFSYKPQEGQTWSAVGSDVNVINVWE